MHTTATARQERVSGSDDDDGGDGSETERKGVAHASYNSVARSSSQVSLSRQTDVLFLPPNRSSRTASLSRPLTDTLTQMLLHHTIPLPSLCSLTDPLPHADCFSLSHSLSLTLTLCGRT